MREQLINYVSLLFAGTKDADDIRQEIMQNTLDRYDDMIAQGKTPEAAYRLAISGIGDINEILNTIPGKDLTGHPAPTAVSPEGSPVSKILRSIAVAIAVGLYILSPIPLVILEDLGMDTIGLCGTLALVAIATALIVLARKKQPAFHNATSQTTSAQNELSKSIDALIWAVGLALYFIISFSTRAWFITWVIFPMIATVQGIVKACMDLKEGK